MSGTTNIACCLLLALFSCPLYAQTPVLVQSTKCQDWRNYSVIYECSFEHTSTAGNAIIAFVLVSGSASVVVTNLIDDHSPSSNVYIQDLHYLFADIQNIYFYSAAGAGPARRVTITANSSTHFQVVLMEFRGLLPSGPLKDQTSTHNNGFNSGRTFTSGLTPRTTRANEILVGWNEQIYPNVMTFTDDPAWTLVQQEPIGGSRVVYRTTKTIGSFAYTGSFTGDGDYQVGAAIVTYKATTCGPPD
jgi:hypothetical protein